MENTMFTYAYYDKLVNQIVHCGYKIADYHDFRTINKPCIFRHDVDYDVFKAVEFAAHEANMNSKLHSTFFFLISGEFYNIFSRKTLAAIDKILSLGHEIGLHFDETKYQISEDEKLFIEFVQEELYILGRALETKIKTVSMHRPSKFTLEKDFKFIDAVNCYSKEFFSNFKYLSDSRMYWREDALAVIESGKFDKLHVLTHPFWYSVETENTREKILNFIKRACKDRYYSFTENFRDLDEYVKIEDL